MRNVCHEASDAVVGLLYTLLTRTNFDLAVLQANNMIAPMSDACAQFCSIVLC